MNRYTIDRLILETLAEGEWVTARQIAGRWGEDITRVWEWLEKFRKAGLCQLAATPFREGNPKLKTVAYGGDSDKIAAYLMKMRNS